MENICDRFRAVRAHLDMSQSDMSTKLGLSRNCWQAYELGKSLPGTSVYQSLSEYGISADWLMFGVGNMLISKCPVSRLGYSFLPQYQCVIGDAPVGDHVHWFAFSEDFIRVELRVAVDRLSVLMAGGDAMSPTVNPGDLLIVDHSKHQLDGDGLYLLHLFGGCLVKRVQSMLNGTVKIISDNPAYEAQIVDGSDFDHLYVAGRIVWHGGRV